MTDHANIFAGTWQLKSFEYRNNQGTVIHPYGEDAVGYLIIGQDNYLSVTFAAANRPNFVGGDMANATKDERNEACRSYFSYVGKANFIPQQEKVQTDVMVSLLPNWTGKTHERTIDYDGEHLSFVTPPDIVGKGFSAYLTFERIQNKA
ncbi:MAG TPA: hypothetical protein DCS93_08075 [Microscillaceae bacterium]|nr:hypothetical protein [Microscillaceae bacterium]